MIHEAKFPQPWIDEYEVTFIESPCITHLFGFRYAVQFVRSEGVPQNQNQRRNVDEKIRTNKAQA